LGDNPHLLPLLNTIAVPGLPTAFTRSRYDSNTLSKYALRRSGLAGAVRDLA
jgi:hypothetical protein